MKRFLFASAILFAFTTTSFAQGDRMYRKFKGELSLGYARFSSDNDIKNGIILALEPKYMVLDQLAIGGRLETVFMGNTIKDSYNDVSDFQLKFYQSLIGLGEFYFTKNYGFRPFVGGGAGIYSVISTNTGADYYNEDDNGTRTFKFGGMVRAGAEIKHFRIGLEYNFIPNTSTAFYNNNGQVYNVLSKNAYVAVKVGFCFSGGPVNK